MAAVAPQPQHLGANGQAHVLPNGSSADKKASGNHVPLHNDVNARAPAAKKGTSKKTADPSETSKLLAAKISQLESDKAGEKDQEADIEREVKRANRDLSNLLSNIESPLSRLEMVQKRYTDLLADMRRLEREYAKSKKRAEQLQKERDAGRTELNKMVSMKEKMEKLSRELQKEKQKLKEENKRLEEVERQKIKDLNERIGKMLRDVQDVVSQQDEPGTQKVDVKTEELFKSRFKTLLEQYDFREQVFAHKLRKKELEAQASMARFENEKKAAEQEVARSRDLRVQVATFSQTETELRSQLNVYVEKFKQVEDTLNNSNDLFLTFRKEMEDMSRKTKRLERENLTLIRKHDLTNRNILEMAEERTRMNKEMELLKKKNANLEKLCRGMQAQGRGVAAAAAAAAAAASSSSPSLAAKTTSATMPESLGENERTESEYEYEEEDDEDDDDDDDDEEDEDIDEEDDEDEEAEDNTNNNIYDDEGPDGNKRLLGFPRLQEKHGSGQSQSNHHHHHHHRQPQTPSHAPSPSQSSSSVAAAAAVRGAVKQRRGPIYGSVPVSLPSSVSTSSGRVAHTANHSSTGSAKHSAASTSSTTSTTSTSTAATTTTTANGGAHHRGTSTTPTPTTMTTAAATVKNSTAGAAAAAASGTGGRR